MAAEIMRHGFEEGCVYINKEGQVGMTSGPPGGRGGHFLVTPDGTTRGGGPIHDENSLIFRPGTMTMPFPLTLLPSIASAPQEIFVPPFMELLPMLAPVVAASAAVVALGAIAKASRG